MRVKVADWANPRDVWERDGKLFFQVSKGHIDCSVCQSRVRFVSQKLHCSRIDHNVHTDVYHDVVDISFPMPPAEKSIPEYLQEILGVSVTEA